MKVTENMQKNIHEKHISKLLKDKKFQDLRKVFAKTDPADIADYVEELPWDEQEKIFAMLDPESASEVIVEMEDNEVDDVLRMFSPNKMVGMAENMAPDDAADFLLELEKPARNKVIEAFDDEYKNEIKKLIGYKEDSAGGKMTSELCAVPENKTVQQVLNIIASTEFSDPISMVFAVDKNQKLLGSVNISTLIAQNKNTKISNVIDKNIIVCKTDDDQEKIAELFRKYDLYAMPVVDDNMHLVGRITADDVMDVFFEEANEDLAQIAGAPDLEKQEDSPLKIAGLRLPWLMLTLFSGVIISVIIQKLTGISKIEALAAFVPVIMAMGGNTGIQASTVTIRNLARDNFQMDKILILFLREMLIGFLMGLVCGIIAGIGTWISIKLTSSDITVHIIKIAAIVSVSMCTAMMFASITGTLMPIFLNKLKIDPAFAAGPFVTTGNDLSASLIYFLMCTLLLTI